MIEQTLLLVCCELVGVGPRVHLHKGGHACSVQAVVLLLAEGVLNALSPKLS